MKFSICPRCESQEFETSFSVCMNCNYGLDNDTEGGVPIPAWVLKHIDPTASELKEIREINFGFQSSVSTAPRRANAEVIPLRLKNQSRNFEPFEALETGQCVM